MIAYTHFRKLLHHMKCVLGTSSSSHLICYFQKNASSPLLLSSVRCISRVASDDQKSFVLSYLINNCGLSPKSALSASKYLHFKTPAKPDSVLSLFRSHGFSESQIAKIIHTLPKVLASNPQKTLLPKIQFFHLKGFSTPDVAKICSVCPLILHTSLEKQLIPTYNVIESLLPSPEKVVGAIKVRPMMMLAQKRDYIVHNIKILKDTGLPQSNIVWLLRHHPGALMVDMDRFNESLEEVKRMGFKPSVISFAVAMMAMRVLSKSTWERKFDIFRKWGWSQEQTIVAFRKFPWVVTNSEKKIMKMMDYYVNQMGWNSSLIAQSPLLISLSFEKRVIPRCSVLQVLLSKDLIRLSSISRPFLLSEKLFLQKFVTPFEEDAPHLLKLYREKLNVSSCERK